MLLINASAPSRAVLGTLNGLCAFPLPARAKLTFRAAQTVASVMRGTAPAVANALFALSSEKRVAGGYLVWICLFLVALVSIGTSWLLQDKPAAWREAEAEE
jgi:hypothetical protein